MSYKLRNEALEVMLTKASEVTGRSKIFLVRDCLKYYLNVLPEVYKEFERINKKKTFKDIASIFLYDTFKCKSCQTNWLDDVTVEQKELTKKVEDIEKYIFNNLKKQVKK